MVNSLKIKKLNKIVLKITLISLISLSVAFAENKNELSIGIAVGNGIMENVKGMHTPVTGNPGTNIKGLVLDDDSLNTIYSIKIGYNKYLNSNLYLNSGISFARHYTVDTYITFDGGYNSEFPNIHFRGLTFELGPNYRFNKISNFTPYIGLNASSFLGFQSDTNYGANGHGLYGVGGPETFVKCLGITPNLGFFVNSGFFKGYGFSIENLLLECDNEHNRSMTEGYEADFNIVQYRIDYRIPF
ncbi:hypothetical protein OAJ40_02500 [Candidatus Pelagibacter sp.]|nr:hypothetical protein [Candidatus Pelagibacter sp.]